MFSDQIHGHVPLSTIANGISEKKVDGAIFNGSIGGFDDGFQEMVGAFKLVPKMDVRLTELKILEIHFLHGPYPKQVERGEKPAPTTSFLIGD